MVCGVLTQVVAVISFKVICLALGQSHKHEWWVESFEISHDAVIKWKHFPRYWPFVRGVHRSPANYPHKGQWRRALMFLLIYAWITGWVNNREAGDLRRHPVHSIMTSLKWSNNSQTKHNTSVYKFSGITACTLRAGHLSNPVSLTSLRCNERVHWLNMFFRKLFFIVI